MLSVRKTSSQIKETANQCPHQRKDGVTSPVTCHLTDQLANPQHKGLVSLSACTPLGTISMLPVRVGSGDCWSLCRGDE